MTETYIYNPDDADDQVNAWRWLISNPDKVITMQRTPQQNKSLHKWLALLADELNASGQSLGDGKLVRLPVRYTGENLKEHVLKPYLNALWPDKDSTTQLSTAELKMLYEDLDVIIAERSGCHVEWPSEESLSEEQR